MGYYTDLRDKIFEVERAGFNPYTESLEGRVGQLSTQSDTNMPPTQESPLKQPQIATQPVSQVEPQAEEVIDYTKDPKRLVNDYRRAQADVTKALIEANPNIPIVDILNEYASMKDFKNTNLDQYFQELTDKYGEIKLGIDDVNKANPNFYKLQEEIRKADKRGYGYTISTRGDKEGYEPSHFSWRDLLERRGIQGEDARYQYLIDIEGMDEKVKDQDKVSKELKKNK